MALSSYGRTTRQETFLSGQLLASGDQAQMAGSGLTIRYKNGPEGMRQDFVIEQAPLDQGELMLVFSVEKNSVNFECSDGQGLSFVMDRPGGAAVYSYSDLKVYDAGGQTLPGRFQRTGEDGFAIVVDDSRAAYPVTVDPLSTSPNWTAESNQDSAYYGRSVAPAGDVNGDGFSDVIVGSRAFDNGQADEGRAYVYHGSSIGLSPSPNWTAESDQDGAYFGFSVASAGDVNGDGYSDVVVGAYGYDNGQSNEGRAFVYHGSASGLSATADWTAESNQADSYYGRAAATAGDVNGDGYGDLIVGAYMYDNGQSNEGRAYVYYGNNGGGQDVRPGQFRTDLATPVVPALKTYASDQAGLGLWGRTYYGRGDIKAQFEVKPLGTPFNGTGLSETGWFDSQTNGAQMSQVVALSPGSRYKWRARAKYKMTDGATQPYGRWIYQPYNGGLGEADFYCLASDPSAVHLSYFTAARVGSGVEMKWRTESEEDSDHWVIERRPLADENYKPIGELAAQGMSNLPHDYNYFDKETLEKGEYHYRIGEVDKAGNTVYYGPVSVDCLLPDRFLLLPASPNPSGGKAVFRYQLPREAEVRLEIYNVAGQKVKSLDQGKVPAGPHLVTWEDRQLPNGVYLYRLVAGQISATGRLVMIR